MNIAVIDDENLIREQIKNLVVKQKPDFIVDTYETGEMLLAAGRRYDVVFLDIQMEGRNGLDTAKVLRKQQEDTAIIFITGIKEYVFEAFDVAESITKPASAVKADSSGNMDYRADICGYWIVMHIPNTKK